MNKRMILVGLALLFLADAGFFYAAWLQPGVWWIPPVAANAFVAFIAGLGLILWGLP